MGQEITSKQYAEKIVEVAYYNFPLVHPKETVIKCVDALVKEYTDQQSKPLLEEIERFKKRNEFLEQTNGYTELVQKTMEENKQLQSTISYQQERIGELEKSNENYNKLLNMSLYMAKLFNRTGDFSEFMRSNNLPTNPESLTKKQ